MSKHTPGPWACLHQPARTEEIATVSWVGDWCVGVMTPGFPGGNYRDLDWGSPASDARLIAAAPEQHGALESVLDLLEAALPTLRAAGWQTHNEEAAIRRGRAAIAKATGEQQ